LKIHLDRNRHFKLCLSLLAFYAPALIIGLAVIGILQMPAQSGTFAGSQESIVARTDPLDHPPPATTDKVIPRSAMGRVIDADTGRPVVHATLFNAGKAHFSDDQGHFSMVAASGKEPLLVKAPGYRQTSLRIPDSGECLVKLAPFNAKGLYLTHYGIGSKLLRNRVLELISERGLNSLVIDVKGDRGYLSYKYDVPTAREIGALKIPTIKDIGALIQDLHNRKIYVIGRIVVFKDNLLANAHPEWAIIDTRTGKPWIDNEKLAWVDPFHEEVWRYDIAIARAAAQAGFDEIQFDYVRFPTDGRISAARYSKPNTLENRVKTINRFLETAARELLPYNVYFSADVFGYVPWNFNDTDIGQCLPELARYVDYICLMVYPSGYHLGIPGFRIPVSHPREVVYLTLEQAKKRLNGQAEKFRPWLQNFRDYGFDRRPFTEEQIRLQIQACKQANTSGWMLWDPSNMYRYTADALRPASVPVAKAREVPATQAGQQDSKPQSGEGK
jgi:hypothetical protein